MSELQALIERLGVHPALGPTGEGWDIEHNAEELTTFLTSIPEIATVLEIGTGYRSGLARFMSDHLGWQVTTVDKNDYGHAFPGIEYIVSSERIEFDRQFDLVIIDADHAYEAVETDFVHYGPRADKVIMLHDICGLRDCEGVAKFWREIAYSKKGVLKKGYFEAIADGDQRAGTGWVVK